LAILGRWHSPDGKGKLGHTGEVTLPRWQRKIGLYWEGGTPQMAKENWAILGRWHSPDGKGKLGHTGKVTLPRWQQ